MSFLAGSHLPSPAKKSLLDDPDLNSTNEEARPLQYVAGYQRVGITWIDQPRNQKSKPQKSSGKTGQTTGYKYSADMLALVCHGPVDGLSYVFMDGKIEWKGTINRAGEQYISVQLKRGGTMVLFWGLETQDFYPKLAAVGHPAYRGQCVAYFPQLQFGNGRTAAPNVELGIRRAARAEWLPGLPNNSDDANLVAVAAELITSPVYGQDVDASFIDQPQWLAIAQQLADDDLVASPVISDETSMRQLLSQVFDYFLGYARWTRAGKLQLGLLRDAPADLTVLPKLTASDLIEPPQIPTPEWKDTSNRTVMPFKDRTTYWQANYGQWFDAGNLAITDKLRPQSLQRRWITRASVAANLVQRAGKRAALPQFTATFRARRSSVTALEIGDWFVLDYDAAYLGFAYVMQVTKIKTSGDTTEEIGIEAAGQQITTDPAELADFNEVLKPLPADPEPVGALAQWAVVELPTALTDGSPGVVVAALAVRGGYDTVYANVYDSQDDATYDLLGMVNEFAAGGTLAADYAATADATVAMTVNLLGPDTELPGVDALAAANDKLLVFAGQEILAVAQVAVVSASQVRLYCLRAQFDSVALAHAAGERVFIIAKRALRPFTVDAFSPANQVWFKCQAVGLGDQYDLALVDAQQAGMVGRALLPAPFTALRINGHAGSATFASGGDAAMTWTLAAHQQVGNQTYSGDYYAALGIATVILIFDTPTSLTQKDRIVVPPGVSAYTYTNAQLLAAFGGTQPSVWYARLWSMADGLYSYAYTDCLVSLAGTGGGGGGGGTGGGGGVGSPPGGHYLI